MTADLRAAAQKALVALEYHTQQTRPIEQTEHAIKALMEALAAPSPAEGDESNLDWMDLPGAIAAWNRIRRAALALNPTGSIAETLYAASALADLAFKAQPKGMRVCVAYSKTGKIFEYDASDEALPRITEAPPCWYIDFGSYGHITMRKDEADRALENGAIAVTRYSNSAAQSPAPVAEPTGWVVYWGQPPIRKHSIHFERATAEAAASEIKSTDTRIDPVFSASPAVGADDARDAARYRFIRDADRSDSFITHDELVSLSMEDLDRAIDTAMKQEAQQ